MPVAIGPDDVREWIVSSTGAELPSLSPEDTTLLERVVGAVAKSIARMYVPPEDETDEDWEQAHLMQSARLWGRRNSTNGVEGINSFGPLRVGRLDPDVVELLEPFRSVEIP